jgi:predicted dehydrogenase
MLGLDKPEWVVATGSSFVKPGVEDVAFGTVGYSGGQIANIQASWLDPHKVRRATIVGDKAMAIFDDVATEDRLRIYKHGVDVLPASEYGEFKAQVRSGDVYIPYVETREPLRNMLDAFLQAFYDRDKASIELARALGIVSVLEAMSHSMKIGGSPVKLDWTKSEERLHIE